MAVDCTVEEHSWKVLAWGIGSRTRGSDIIACWEMLIIKYEYSRLSIIRAWFNRFAAQPRQCIFKEKILFSVSITFV
jgi:hypothetical protein